MCYLFNTLILRKTKKLLNSSDIRIKRLKNKLIENEKEILKLRKQIIEKEKEIDTLKNIISNKKDKTQCLIEGKKYEVKVYEVCDKCYINNKKFNNQKISELGGNSSNNDIVCRYENIDIPIELKRSTSPDWMQCSIKYNSETKKWVGSKVSRIPIKSKDLFNTLLNNVKLFNNKIPPFFEKRLTYTEWLDIKSKTTDFNDTYIQIPNDTIKKVYSFKGCKYIQISDRGLYHLGDDICSFNVPEFLIDQQLRIRIKVNKCKDANGYCVLTVMASCQPINIYKLESSKYSLDDKNKLPLNLIFKD